ncbi:hypothetical protein PV328_000960 [Microctonus aethiopoides]|uniref:Testin n=1 Tax=Microctonus aethiopoides TaxID=144406 RepID=A0AA39KWT2_9HYME|nr:hypothetical protein PV328_000960 [Microctonus aethiopoides]
MEQGSQMDNEEGNRPKWLLELENRKRKTRLAHEVGSGAPCLKCDTSCPGLDLHFWRKICKNCKCGRDDHDVSDDEFPQFDLLLGSFGKSKRKFTVLKLNKPQMNDEETFEWTPPDITKELAADYMKALPENKLPIKGSAGAALRKQQLQKQLPLHDIDHSICDALSDLEKKQFTKYLENLKKYVGQGKVSKIVNIRPFNRSFMTPVNASECLSPQHKPNTINSCSAMNLRTPSSFVPKSIYSSVTQSSPQLHAQLVTANKSINVPINSINNSNAVSGKLEYTCAPQVEQAINQPIKSARYHHVLESIKNDDNHIAESSKVVGNKMLSVLDVEQNKIDDNAVHGTLMEMHQSNAVENSDSENLIPLISRDNYLAVNMAQSSLFLGNTHSNDNAQILSSMQRLGDISSGNPINEINSTKTPQYNAADKNLKHSQNPMLKINKVPTHSLLPSSAIYNTDIISSTLNENELSSIREKLMAKYSTKDDQNAEFPIYHSPNCSTISREMKHDSVPANNYNALSNNSSDAGMNSDIPIEPIHATINCYRNPDNTSMIHSEKLQNSIFPEGFGTSKVSNDNLELAIDNLSINESKIRRCHGCDEGIYVGDVVVTAEKANDAAWHPGCFACCTCNELLVDLVYFYYEGKLYCARDLASLMKIPRCFACDELIFVREYTVAEGHNYHIKHFCCWDCDVPLAGKQYISENDRPLCLNCYQKTYAKSCCACNQLIAADQQGVAVKDLNFHATNECFCCHNCNKSLLNGKMAIKESKLFCSKECITMFLNKNLCLQ